MKQLDAGTPAGSFELVLTRATDQAGLTWRDKIRPQDTVVIQMMNYQGPTNSPTGAGEMHTVMIGLVDTVTDTTRLSSQGIPQRRIVVRGRDFGKLMSAGAVTYWSFAGAQILNMEAFAQASAFIGPPHVVIERLLEEVFERFMRIQLDVAGTKEQFWNTFAYRLESYGTETPLGFDYQFLGGEGTFWSFLSKVASPPFHELFLDTRRVADTVVGQDNPAAGVSAKVPVTTLGQDASAPTLILRPPPFPYLPAPAATALSEHIISEINGDTVTLLTPVTVMPDVSPWDALPVHEAGTDDLVGEPFDQQLSMSDLEQCNVYLVFPHYIGLKEKEWLERVSPVIDRAKFQKYGYKLYMPATTLLKDPASPGDSIVGFYQALTWRLASWHVFNDRFLSGTKTFKLLPHVHIGERLRDYSVDDQPHEFYIESVSHHFIQNEKATTTLGLTRGLSLDDHAHYSTLLREAGLTAPEGAAAIRDVYSRLMHAGQQFPQ